MKKFLVKMTTRHTLIEADMVRFEPGHVTFWEITETAGIPSSRLIRAIHNPAVEQVEEIEPASRGKDGIEFLDVSVQDLADSDE